MSLVSQGTNPTGPGPEQPLVRFGDFYLTEHWLVTPQGSIPLAGTEITVTDQTRTESATPGWAVVVAIVGFFFIFLFSLLFLLAKENRVTGFVQITVQNGGFVYQTSEPATYNVGAQLYELQTRANYARALIAKA